MVKWRYIIAVGSNLGNREAHFNTAAQLLNAGGIAQLLVHSSVVETAAVGGPIGQGSFLNAVWIAESAFGPHQLLAELQRIERLCGRVRTVHWGPRTIDLDLIVRDDGCVMSSGVLTMPHPRLLERPFVVLPLREVAGNWPVVQRLLNS